MECKLKYIYVYVRVQCCITVGHTRVFNDPLIAAAKKGIT